MNSAAMAAEARLIRTSSADWIMRARGLTVLALLFALLVLSRKPAVILHAEFWGDDGWSWYPDAYRLGPGSLLLPVNGYLNTLQRLVGLAVQPFPLAWAPRLFASVALVVQVAPAVFLVSHRMEPVWPATWARLLFAVVFLVLPNEIELYVNLTNAQWNLALLAFLVLVSAAPQTNLARGFDAAVLVLAGLSGPFCLLLLPVAAVQLYQQRDATSLWRAGLLCATAVVQLAFMLSQLHAGRSTAPLGAGPRMLARIVSLEVLLGVELGYRTIRSVPALASWQDNIMPLTVAAAGCVLAVLAVVRGSRLLFKLVLFGGLVLAASLASPQVSATDPQWAAMATPPMGNRYYTFAMLAWVGILFTLAADRNRSLRGIGVALLVLMAVWGIPGDWRQIRMPPTDFVARAHAFERAPPGTRMEFPIHPPGLSPMVLIKRGR